MKDTIDKYSQNDQKLLHQKHNKVETVSRRQFIKTSCIAACGTVIGFPFVHAQNKIELRFLANGVTFYKQIAEKAKQDLGIIVKLERAATSEEAMARAISRPNTIDFMDLDFGHIKSFMKMRMVKPLETSRLKYFDQYSSVFTKGSLGNRKLSQKGGAPIVNTYLTSPKRFKLTDKPTDWMAVVPTVFNADTLGIRPDLIKRPIRNWSELLNPEFKGKAAIINIPHIGILDAAMAIESMGKYSYKDIGNMTRKEIDKTIEILIAAKKNGQFFAMWNDFTQSVDLISSGKVVIQSMWSPAVTKVRQQGIPCIYQPLKEGFRGWCYGIALSRAVPNKRLDAVYDFLNWYQSGWVGAFLNRQGYYSSVPSTAQKFMKPYEWDYWMNGKPAENDILSPDGIVIEKKGTVRDGGSFSNRIGNIAVWNTLMDESRYLLGKWREFVDA
ncbi:ABC transporter substrate-binding protein [Candidatus Magnetomorum sp. HK-1]|nr:ABC transporter substrate-binding protein [Candidatus Magnetomorum sp. HK-1]